MMIRPLLALWRIRADELPDRLLDMERPSPAFSLPGAASLAGFAELLGEEAKPKASIRTEDEDAPFPLPAMLPDDVPGCAELFCELDFGALPGDRAVLTFDEIVGCGEILLGDTPIAAFSGASAAEEAAELTAAPCALAVDMTDALRRGRKETLRIRFTEARPAGIPGPVFLRMSSGGFMTHLTVLPSAPARTMTVCVNAHAVREGRYALRISPQPACPGLPIPPAREMTLSLNPSESRECRMSLSIPGDLFIPGLPYCHAALRAKLLYMEGTSACPCDSVLIAAGYPGRPALSYVPLSANELAEDCESLIKRLSSMHISSVGLTAPAPDCFYHAAARAGVSVHQYLPDGHSAGARLARHPCVCLDPLPAVSVDRTPAEEAWQLCGVTGMTRTPDPDLTPAGLLQEAAGRVLDISDEGVSNTLSWLSAVSVRLRAEAARQNRLTGPLCAPGQLAQPDIADALLAALTPMHLSALPLLGAWWAGTRFSAALEAFIGDQVAARYRTLTASAVLEDDEGHEIARVDRPFAPRSDGRGTPVGVIEATLPDTACVLTLTCRLMDGHTVLEENSLPIYVGLRGPLEAAF